MILQGSPKKINRNRMVLGRKKPGASAIQVVSDDPAELQTTYVWAGTTEDATPAELFLNDDGVSVYEVIENQALAITATVIARNESNIELFAWRYYGVWGRDGSGNIEKDRDFSEVLIYDAAMKDITYEFKADNVNYKLYPEVTGKAATTIKWQIVGEVNTV